MVLGLGSKLESLGSALAPFGDTGLETGSGYGFGIRVREQDLAGLMLI